MKKANFDRPVVPKITQDYLNTTCNSLVNVGLFVLFLTMFWRVENLEESEQQGKQLLLRLC